MQLLADQRRKRDAAAGAATLTRQRLENCDWAIQCARADLAQLELVKHPPSAADYRPVDIAVVKRPAPAFAQNYDPIEWPAGTKPATNADGVA